MPSHSDDELTDSDDYDEQGQHKRGTAAVQLRAAAGPPSKLRSQQTMRIVRNDDGSKLGACRFIFPPEQHISVTLAELKQAIKDRLPLDERHDFDEFVKLLTGMTNFDFTDLKQRLQMSFLPFASGARNTTFLQRSSKSLPTTKLLDDKEDELVSDVYEVLRASHYTLLTEEEWELATSENFNLNLPMEIKWAVMDPGLLRKFWSSSTERAAIRKALPNCMADRILVFHRGIGTEKLTGLLLDQKIDLLMDYTVVAGYQRLAQLLGSAWHRLRVMLGLVDEKGQAAGLAKAATMLRSMTTGRAVSEAFVAQVQSEAAMDRYELAGDSLVVSDHRFAKTVERMTLSRQCPTLFTLLKSFPRKMELEEPTYKELVVLYRRALPPRKRPAASANAPHKTKLERMQGILAYRNINLKVFGETPMADVEMIFPEKAVAIKPLHLVHLVVTLLGSLVAGTMAMLRKGGEHLGSNVLWSAAGVVLMRLFTIYNQAQTQRSLLQERMTNVLFDKMAHSQEGVISIIVEEMADQQLKQLLLAYMLLIIKERPMLPHDLDKFCEDFLLQEFGQPVDFDLEAALPRLKSWYLVQEDARGKLAARPLGDAKAVLENAWSTAYTCIGSTDQFGNKRRVPTEDLITGEVSVFAEGIKLFLDGRDIDQAVADVTHTNKNMLSAGLGMAGNVAKGAGRTVVGAGRAVGAGGAAVVGAGGVAGKAVVDAGGFVGKSVGKTFDRVLANPLGKKKGAGSGDAAAPSSGFGMFGGRQGKPPLAPLRVSTSPDSAGAAAAGPASCPGPEHSAAAGRPGYHSAPLSPGADSAAATESSSNAGSVDGDGVTRKRPGGLKKSFKKLMKKKDKADKAGEQGAPA